jgi:RHS repeat-associated protein
MSDARRARPLLSGQRGRLATPGRKSSGIESPSGARRRAGKVLSFVMALLLVWASAAPAVLAASGLERRGASRTRPAAVGASEALPPPTVPLLPTHVGIAGGDDAWQLFDGDGATSLEAQGGGPRQIWLGFDRPRLVRELWVDAASEGVVGVELEDESGKRWPIPGLEQVSLRRGEATWHKLSVDAPVPIRALALTWLPAGPDARLGELRVRGPGDAAPAARPITEQLYAGASSGLSVHEGEPRATTIARAHLGASPGHRVVVPLAQDPRAFERAYLVYELSGLASWVEVPRRLNGIAAPEPAAPRARAVGAGGWHQQVEEVATGWLRRGDNVLEFSPVAAAVAAEYGVRNVRLVGVPRGTDAVVRLDPRASEGASNSASGSAGEGSEGSQTSAGGLRFDAPTRVSALAFHLPSRSRGVLRLFAEAVGRPDDAGERPLLSVPLAGLSPGWQRVALNESAALRALRAEVDVRGEGVTAPTALRLESHETLPAQGAARLAVLHAPPGECRGREAMVRGFLAAHGEPATLRIDGRPIALGPGGAFMTLSREPEGKRGRGWTARLEASFADGRVLAESLSLGPCLGPPEAEPGAPAPVIDEGAPYGEVVRAGEAKTLSFAGATLEIPAGAVERDVRITVRPLGQGELPAMGRAMVNVTPGARGFRFGPHGLAFKKPVTLRLPYDATALKPGMGEGDVHAFYFDEPHRNWRRVTRAERPRGGAVVSLSEHFTDFVAATLAQPDAPGAQSFDENTIKGVALASPSAGVTLIDAPAANSRGSASLAFPLEVPAGRRGVEPALTLSYDSANKENGWLGLGWDLGLPSVRVETRFGVPKYDGTELYLLEGAALAPEPVKGPGGARFRRRVEGAFERIERSGGSPADYVWTVTDKAGTRYTYGASPNARLADPETGRVAEWLLERVEDVFGNTMLVTYAADGEAVSVGGRQNYGWVQRYPERIDYTGHAGGTAPRYHVDFELEGGRTDVRSEARFGFETRTRQRLREVRMRLDDDVIRSYRFEYKVGAFGKTLLAAVAMRGLGGAEELYRHRFDYYELPSEAGIVEGFSPPVDWGDPGAARAHGLGGDRTVDGGVNFFAGVGPTTCFPHVGVGVGVSGGDDASEAALRDMNGDGRADLVLGSTAFVNGGEGSWSPAFGLPGGAKPGGSTQMGASLQLAAHLPGEIGGFGVDWNWSWVNESASLDDVNGDGFADWFDHGNVLFSNGRGFSGSSTPLGPIAPPVAGPPRSPEEEQALDQLGARLHRTSPLVAWLAPRSGTLLVGGAVSLEPGASGDGVLATVTQSAGDGLPPYAPSTSHLLWRRTIAPGAAPCVPAGDGGCGDGLMIKIARGDRLYFRVDPREGIEGDLTSWNPSLRYLSDCDAGPCSPVGDAQLAEHDAFGLPRYAFEFASELRLVDRNSPPSAGWVAAADGEVDVASVLSLPEGAPPLQVSLLRRRGPSGVLTRLAEASASGGQSVEVRWHVAVSQGDELFALAPASTAGIDPARITWAPIASYTRLCGLDGNASVCRNVVACEGEAPESPCTLEALPGEAPAPTAPLGLVRSRLRVGDSDEPGNSTETAVGREGRVHIGGALDKAATAGSLTVALVRNGERIAQRVLGPGPLHSNDFPGIDVELRSSDRLALRLYAEQPGDLDGAAWDATLTFDDGASASVPVRRAVSAQAAHPLALGGGFRGWAFGEWTTDDAFDENLFFAAPETDRPAHLHRPVPRPEGAGGVLPSRWQVPAPVWTGIGADFFIAPGRLKPSRIGGRSPAELASAPGLGRSRSTTRSVGGNFAGASAQLADGTSSGDQLVLDLNGDNRVDVLNGGAVQYQGCGAKTCDGREAGSFGAPLPAGLAFGDVRRTDSRSVRFGLGFGSAASALTQKLNASGTTREIVSVLPSLGRSYGTAVSRIDVVDVNGDGLLDHLAFEGGQWLVQLNLGYHFTPPLPWSIDGGLPATVRPLDGPGIADEVLTFGQDADLRGVRAQDTATNSLQIGYAGIGGGVAHSVTRTLVDFLDVNGDGLPDRVAKNPDEALLRVRLNLGDRFGGEELWRLPSWGVPLEKSFTRDLNGSNDVLSFQESTSLNVGAGTGPVYLPVWLACVVLEFSATTGLSQGATALSWSDFDGDGTLDQVLRLGEGPGRSGAEAGAVRVKLNRTGKANLLRTVSRPLGGTIRLDYAREGNRVALDQEPKVDMPQGLWVLSRREIDDGRGHTHANTYDYGASGFHDRAERESYGFARVTTTREDGSQIVEHFFNQDYYRRGLLRRRVEQGPPEADGSRRLWRVEEVDYREPTPGLPTLRGSFFAAERERRSYAYEGLTSDLASPGKATRERRTYDGAGNLVSFVDEGDAGSGDDVAYEVHYHHDAARNLFLPNHVTARDAGGKLLRERRATYAPGTGALETLTTTLVGGKDPATGAPYAGTRSPTWRFTHDAWGNVATVTDPKGFVLSYEFDEATHSQRTRVEDSFGYVSTAEPDLRFGEPRVAVDVNGHRTRFERDTFGRLVQVFGPDDADGDTPSVALAYGLQPGAAPLPAWATTAHKDVQHPGDPLMTATFVDGLDRVIQTKKDLERDTGTGTELGMAVSGRVEFDMRGRLAAQGQPVFDAAPPEAFVDIPLKNPTRYAYDVLSRERRVELPDGAVTATDHDFGELDGAIWLRTTLTDAKGTRSIEYADAGGRTVAIQEPGSAPGHPGPIVTRYEHDPLDQLVRVKDAEGNVTSVEYDTLGHRIALTSPDAGHSEWRYDLGGDLGAFETARLRALGQLIRYRYAFHRLERVDFPDGTAPVVYEYGGPELAGDADGNRAGRLVRESSESGTREASYDRFGRVARESFEYVTMRGEGHGPFRAAFEYEHDAFGRLLELRYPGLGDEIVRYGYDRGGELSSVAGDSVRPTPPGGQFHTDYLKHVGYDEFGERVRVVVGNGITTRYTYEPLRRHLERVEADHHDPFLQQHGLPPRPMQRLHYQFDPAGNLLEARNDVPPDDLPNAQVTVGPTLYTFAYDERYQLTGAEGLYQTRDDRRFRYSFTQQYDAIGNLLRKTQMSVEDKKQGNHWNAGHPDRDLTYDAKYAYRGPRPHAPTEIVEKGPPPSQPEKHTFAYDEDGQQVEAIKHQGDRRRLTWDAAGRVKQIDRNGQALSRALYGAKGERTHHLSLGEETVYFNQYLTERFGQYPTKHIYAGGERIASKVDPEWLGQAPTLYYHPDLLGSTHYVTNDEQELVQHAEYFPGGELWADEVNGSYQQRRPAYLFTGKELDEATGLYYYGARYYDPRQGQWLSPDPALAEYAFGAPVGGFYAPKNLWAYTYSWNNPVALRDRDGRIVDTLADVGFIGYDLYRLVKDNAIDRKGNLGENLAALGADVVGAALPFATGLGTVVRVGKAADRAVDAAKAADKVVDAAKAADKAGGVAQAAAHADDAAKAATHADDAAKATARVDGAANGGAHLNGNHATSEFGLYEIRVNGELHKVGKADLSRVTKSSGLPTRVHQQVRKLKQTHGEDVGGRVVEKLGQTTTGAAKAAETARLQAIHKATGKVPPGNARSFKP